MFLFPDLFPAQSASIKRNAVQSATNLVQACYSHTTRLSTTHDCRVYVVKTGRTVAIPVDLVLFTTDQRTISLFVICIQL